MLTDPWAIVSTVLATAIAVGGGMFTFTHKRIVKVEEGVFEAAKILRTEHLAAVAAQRLEVSTQADRHISGQKDLWLELREQSKQHALISAQMGTLVTRNDVRHDLEAMRSEFSHMLAAMETRMMAMLRKEVSDR